MAKNMFFEPKSVFLPKSILKMFFPSSDIFFSYTKQWKPCFLCWTDLKQKTIFPFTDFFLCTWQINSNIYVFPRCLPIVFPRCFNPRCQVSPAQSCQYIMCPLFFICCSPWFIDVWWFLHVFWYGVNHVSLIVRLCLCLSWFSVMFRLLLHVLHHFHWCFSGSYMYVCLL